jgi:TolB-like protein
MAVKNFSLLAVLVLNGCATFNSPTDVSNSSQQEQKIELQKELEDGSSLASSLIFHKQFNLKLSPEGNNLTSTNSTIMNNSINQYVKVLMQDLVSNLHHFNSSTPVAVVSFVMLDSDYNKSTLLGKQIAESLIHEVHNFGIPVIDFKTTGFVRVTSQGDFAFSKNNEELSSELAAQYIIGGTMLKHKDGYLINARIVGVQSKTVVASAQSLIPNDVVNVLLPSAELNTEFKTVQLVENTDR